jgi:hypothetical protein
VSHPDLLRAKAALGIPAVVCICGSTRFWEQMAEAAWAQTLAGNIVVRPDVDMKRPHLGYADAAQVKTDLDELHRAKIRLADRVLVVGDYVGQSTTREIAYARSLGLPVDFTHPEADPIRVTDDDVLDAFYGVRVVSFEDGDAALTHDRRRAIAAFSAVQRVYNCETLRACIDPDDIDSWLTTGWLRLDRFDGWWRSTTADDPRAIPATWLCG